MYRIVFFDIDGTLLNTNRTLPQSTIDSVHQLREQGIVIAIASGRTPFNIEHILAQLEIDSYVVYNGGLVVNDGDVLYRNVIEADTIIRMQARARTLGHALVLDGAESFTIVGPNREGVVQNYMRSWDKSRLTPEFRESSVYQVELFCPQEDVGIYQSEFPSLTFYPWMSKENAFNVIPKGVSKAGGIEQMLSRLGMDKNQAAAFGDGHNDFEMLSFVGMGVAMGNAVDALKDAADYVTKHVDEDGIYHGLIHLNLLKSSPTRGL